MVFAAASWGRRLGTNSPRPRCSTRDANRVGLFEARNAIREQGLPHLVTEGYMDVVALAQLAFLTPWATAGNGLHAGACAKLLRFTDAVVFSFDGDAAERRAPLQQRWRRPAPRGRYAQHQIPVPPRTRP